MKPLLISFLLLCTMSAFSQNFQWVRAGSGIGQDVGERVTVDQQGNVYVTGNFAGEAHFSGTLFTGNGIFDMFVAKYDDAGNLKWLRSAGGIQSDEGFGIKTDNDGNVYVTGYFSEIAEFHDDRGVTIHLPTSGNADIFLAKYDSSGNLLWAKKAGGEFEDQAKNMTIDSRGNIFITGHFSDRCYFGSQLAISKGNTDAFIARYDTSGNCIWVQSLGGSGLDKGLGIAVDSSGSSYINGFFYYDAFLSNSSEVIHADGLSSDIFVAKYDLAGNNEWAQRMGGPYPDGAFAIAVDEEENYYITGYYLEIADFGDFSLDAEGYNDIFIAKYDSFNVCEWAISEGGVHLDIGLDIGLDQSGNVYVSGTFDSVATFGNEELFAVDYYDMFISKYNDKGVLQWVRQAGGNMGDFALSICVQNFDMVYVTGYYKNIATFGSIETPFGKESDIFVARISYPVGIDEQEAQRFSFALYPNPNDGAFTLQFPQELREQILVTVTDLHGKEMMKTTQAAPAVYYSLQIDLPAAGIYFVTVQGESFSKTQRIAVLK